MVYLRKFYLIVIMLLFFLSPGFAQESGSFEGTIITKDGKPVFNATIIVKNSAYKVFSEVNGTYSIEDVAPGVYTLFAYKYGYQTVTVENIGVKAGLKTQIDFKLVKDPASQGCGAIAGQISNAKNTAISGARIVVCESIVPQSGKLLTYDDFIRERSKIESNSGNDGKFQIENVPPGRYFVFAFKDGYKPYMHFAVYVETGKIKEINVTLIQERYGKIIGVISSNDGDLIPGANIILTGTRLGAASDPYGNFLINDIPPGRYIVKASMLGFKNWQQSVTVRASQVTRLNISIEPEKYAKSRQKSEQEILDEKVEQLRQAYFFAENEDERNNTVSQLRQVLKRMFELKEKNYARKIEMEKRDIQMLEQLQKHRAENQQEIIERRVKELLTVY